MGHEEDVMKIGKKLDKVVSRKEGYGQAKDMLIALKEIPITLEILQHTRIGMAVNNLRKNCSDEEIISISKTLIRSWKKLLETSKEGTTKSDNSGESNNSSSASSSLPAANNSVVSNEKQPRQLSFPSNTTNEVRLKCRQLLADALKLQPNLEEKEEAFFDVEDLASKIEDCIFKEFKDTNMKYKNRIRSRIANLKDAKNPDLKLNVLRGHIKPVRIAVMTAEEMASAEMKELRKKFTKEAINDHQMAVTGGTKTHLIKCPNCKKNNCTYNQVQTRSADEPMTTFCLCNECGKRWKFC